MTAWQHVILAIAFVGALVGLGVDHIITGTECFGGVIGIAAASGVYTTASSIVAGVGNAAASGARAALETLTEAVSAREVRDAA